MLDFFAGLKALRSLPKSNRRLLSEERVIHGPAQWRVKPLRFPTRPSPKVELRLLADAGKNHDAVLKDSFGVGLFQTVQPRRYLRLRESRALDRETTTG